MSDTDGHLICRQVEQRLKDRICELEKRLLAFDRLLAVSARLADLLERRQGDYFSQCADNALNEYANLRAELLRK